MSKTRSRNYPSLGLGDAIDRARVLYKQEGRARAPGEVVVRAWGYNTLNGASLRVLSALRQYGLLEGGNDDTRLSDRALALILEPEDSATYGQALQACLNAPALFQEIVQEYGSEIPSDAALVSYLVRRQNFNEGAARTLIQVFRESADLVRSSRAVYIEPSEGDSVPKLDPGSDRPKILQEKMLAQPVPDRSLEFTSGNIVAKLAIYGGSASEADVTLVSQWLKLAEAALRAAISFPATAQPESADVQDEKGQA